VNSAIETAVVNGSRSIGTLPRRRVVSRRRLMMVSVATVGVTGVLVFDLVTGLLITGAACLLAAVVLAGRRPLGRSVAIVGSGEFSAWAVRVAQARGRRVVAVIHPDDQVETAIPVVDELLVDCSLYGVIDDVVPDSRARCRLLFATCNGAAISDAAPSTTTRSSRQTNPFDPVLSAGARAFKRALDLLVLLVVSPFVLVAAPFIAIAVKMTSRGPVLFTQQRVGADGKLFRLYKFRTMFVNNDDSAHREYVAALMRDEAPQHDGMFKMTHDPRVTRVGRFLRRYSLDELPQLWNVLRGDMSIVGPRPPLLTESQDYDLTAWDRLRVPPGLTGLWQVSGRCALSFTQMVELDVEYWRTWSPMLEIRILARTPLALASTRGAA